MAVAKPAPKIKVLAEDFNEIRLKKVLIFDFYNNFVKKFITWLLRLIFILLLLYFF